MQPASPTRWSKLVQTSYRAQAGPSRLLFANLVFLDCSVCNLTALSVYPDCLQQANQSGRSRWFLNNYCTRPYFSWPIPNYPDHFHEKMWYDLPLLVYVRGNTLHKKIVKCDHCNPLNQHVDQSLATRCVVSPFVQQWVSGPRWGRSVVVIADILFCNIIWSVVSSFDFRWSWIDSR